MIQAVCNANLETFKILLQFGCDINDVGHICLSKRRQNAVASNAIGAAAYHSNYPVLNFILTKLKTDMINVKAIETADRRDDKTTFKHEFHDFTPLQLAIISPKPQLNIIKTLLSHDANQNVKTA